MSSSSAHHYSADLLLPAALIILTVGVAGFRHGPSPLLVRAGLSSLYRVGATGIATRPRSGPRPSGCRMGIRDGYPALSLVVVPGWSAAVSSVAYRGVGGSICRRGDLAPWVVQTPPRLHVDRCRSLQPPKTPHPRFYREVILSWEVRREEDLRGLLVEAQGRDRPGRVA